MLSSVRVARAPTAPGVAARERGVSAAFRPVGIPSIQRSKARRSQVLRRYKETDNQPSQLELGAGTGSWRRHFHESDAPDQSEGTASLVQRSKEVVRELPISLADLLLPLAGTGAAFALTEQTSAVTLALGAGAGVLARALQAAFLEQTVPFTMRRHTLLLPVGAELTMGQKSYEQVLNQNYKNKILPADHPDSKLVQKIATRIIDAVEQQHGAGFQDHIKKFEWEVAVVKDDTVNAFVLPGGKIVVFTGILDLMDRQEDMIATIIGHECAHAVARHSAEKLTLGLFVTAAAQLALAFFGGGQQGGPGGPGGRGGYGRGYPQQGRGYPPQGRYGQIPRRYGQRGAAPPYYWGAAAAAAAAGGSGAPPPGASAAAGGPGLGGLLGNPRIVDTAVNLLLQLPFSRRAEAEADLIGLKLMALAGYNPDHAPTTFAIMEQHDISKRGGGGGGGGGVRLGQRRDQQQEQEQQRAIEKRRQQQQRAQGGLMSAIQTHPRSASRVKLLEQELELMKQERSKGGNRAAEVVLSKVPYWML